MPGGIVSLASTVYAVWYVGIDYLFHLRPYEIANLSGAPATAILLLVGSVMLLCRKIIGRTMVILGSALVLALHITTVLAWQTRVGLWMTAGPVLITNWFGGFSTISLALIIFPLVTLVLAAVPATARWCRYQRPPPAYAAPPPFTPTQPAPGIHAPRGIYIPPGSYLLPGSPATGGQPIIVPPNGIPYVAGTEPPAPNAVPLPSSGPPPRPEENPPTDANLLDKGPDRSEHP